jgi:hypothetical protein
MSDDELEAIMAATRSVPPERRAAFYRVLVMRSNTLPISAMASSRANSCHAARFARAAPRRHVCPTLMSAGARGTAADLVILSHLGRCSDDRLRVRGSPPWSLLAPEVTRRRLPAP